MPFGTTTRQEHVMFELLLLLSLPAIAIEASHDSCVLPGQWRGRWFQSGLGVVEIGANEISRKGTCLEHRLDYYLVQDRRNGCYRCLLIMERHENLLQYKESYCLQPSESSNLQRICERIRAEEILYTLVREQNEPKPCPFHGAYHFQYNRDSNGECVSRASYVRGCAKESKLRLQFGRCDDVEFTRDEALDLECLATWKDGSDTFVYGVLSGANVPNDWEHRYKCIMYDIVGNKVHMAMSADATCRGLDTPRDGPLVMTLTKDTLGLPHPSCIFPSWLIRTTWRDLSGRHIFTMNTQGDVMTMTSSTLTGEHVVYGFHCLQLTKTVSDEVIALSFASDDCDFRYQCLTIRKRHRNILEIHIGSYQNQDSSGCFGDLTTRGDRYIVFPMGLEGTPCPYEGVYSTPVDQTNCEVNFASGCNTSSQISILSSCVTSPVGRLECLESWTENDRKYVIARLLGTDKNNVANCFSFQHRGRLLEFAIDHQCNMNVASIVTSDFKYKLQPHPDTCAKKMPPTTTTTIKPERRKPKKHPERRRKEDRELVRAYVAENISVISGSELVTRQTTHAHWLSCVICFIVMVILVHR